MMNLSATHAVSVKPTTGEMVSSLPWAQRTRGSTRRSRLPQRAIASGVRRRLPTAPTLPAPQQAAARPWRRGGPDDHPSRWAKPIAQARGEVAKSANLCDWYAEHGPAMLATEATLVENNQAVIEYRPLGAILAVMPWNFPVWQVMRGAVPILLAGNSYC